MDHIIPAKEVVGGSTSWRQPDRSEILVSEDTAVMPQAACDMLHDYSHSYPTGVYKGKMWKCRIGDTWHLRWYGHLPEDLTQCSIEIRRIEIMDWKAMMGL